MTLKELNCASDQRHTFKQKGTPAKFRIRLLDEEGKPRKNLRYKLNIDGKISSGRTNNDGRLERTIPPNAHLGTLTLTDDAGQILDIYELVLGALTRLDGALTDTRIIPKPPRPVRPEGATPPHRICDEVGRLRSCGGTRL